MAANLIARYLWRVHDEAKHYANCIREVVK